MIDDADTTRCAKLREMLPGGNDGNEPPVRRVSVTNVNNDDRSISVAFNDVRQNRTMRWRKSARVQT